MEYFLINPFTTDEKRRVVCITKMKHTFEDENGKFTKGIYEMLECSKLEHYGYPYNEKEILGGFIVDLNHYTYPSQSYFGYKLGVDVDGDTIYRFLGGKSLFYTESNHSEEEVYEFLKDILYFPKDEMENILVGDTIRRYSDLITFKPNSIFPTPYYPPSLEEIIQQRLQQSEFI